MDASIYGRNKMNVFKILLTSVFFMIFSFVANANKEIKIGVIFDYTGPLAGGGSDLQALGVKIVIDHFNKNGGVEGYKINAVYADAQSKPEVAINEATRLVEQEKVDMLMGFYSSAQCVPVSAKLNAMKKFMWITTCISPAVLKNQQNIHQTFHHELVV